MVCIYCSGQTKVNNSRLQRRNNRVWRRRECLNCAAVFTTQEYPDLFGALRVAGRDGTLTPFDRDRLFIDLYESLRHRPDALNAAGALADTIMGKLINEAESPAISRTKIIDLTHAILGRFDGTAAAVFAAYHPLP